MGIAIKELDASTVVQQMFVKQQQAFRADPYPLPGERKQKLKALRKQIMRYQDVLTLAMSKDFGYRPAPESKMLDLLSSVLEINHALSHLSGWMRPKRRRTELLFTSNSLQVTYQPKGVVGIIVPWNFPVYLAIGPLVAALAAGNRAMIKLSEMTPATNSVLARMLCEIFDESEVAVVGAELTDPNEFTALPFNHLVFTGSPGIGKVVMRTAAANLTPVTLELGGKSPAIILPDYRIDEAAKRIAHGKSTNGGQICVAPDYVLLPRHSVDDFVTQVVMHFNRLHGDNNLSNYTTVINDRHLERLHSILTDAESKGATVIQCGYYRRQDKSRTMPLHIVIGCHGGMRIMQEELFGPILPIVPYDSFDEILEYINSGHRPLALYCFSHDVAAREKLLKKTHSGGVTINDWGWHAMNHDAPFGGIGNSGMGTYHGVEGFRELSHARTVFKRHRFFPIDLFYPPYGNFVQRLTLRLFLGKADSTIKH